MSGPKITKTRKRQLAIDTAEPAGAPEPVAVTPATPTAPPPAAPRPTPAPPREEPRPQLNADDLMAIAQMDAGALKALMEGSIPRQRAAVGERVTGRITRVGAKDVFVEIGGKAEATIDRMELPHAVVGAEISAMVLRRDENGVRLSLKLTGAAALDHLEDAMDTGVPVEGKVVGRNKGGFEVMIGSVRAFCPVSRISRIPEVDLDAFVGRTMAFRVLEVGDKVVLDRRALQDEEVAEKAEALWATLEVGESRRGVVRNVQPFGVFVDLGGVDGLVPSREILGETPSVGQGLEVRVLEIDRENRRLTLSARDPANDPWNRVGVDFVPGGLYRGTVVRTAPFGAFVELADGLVGLVHASRLSAGLPKIGTELSVRLQDVDRDRQRLELVPATTAAVDSAVGVTVRGTVTDVLRNGMVIQLSDGRSAWLPDREVDLPPGTVLAQRFRRGKEIEARVLEDGDRRLVVSMRENPEEADNAWRAHEKPAAGSGFGTLGDLLGNLKLK